MNQEQTARETPKPSYQGRYIVLSEEGYQIGITFDIGGAIECAHYHRRSGAKVYRLLEISDDN